MDLLIDTRRSSPDGAMVAYISQGPRWWDDAFDPQPGHVVEVSDDLAERSVPAEVLCRHGDRVVVRVAEPPASVMVQLRTVLLELL